MAMLRPSVRMQAFGGGVGVVPPQPRAPLQQGPGGAPTPEDQATSKERCQIKPGILSRLSLSAPVKTHLNLGNPTSASALPIQKSFYKLYENIIYI